MQNTHPDDNELHFCKGKREAMGAFSRWLKEHATNAKNAIESEVDHKTVLEITIGAMEIMAKLLDDDLQKLPKYISVRSGVS